MNCIRFGAALVGALCVTSATFAQNTANPLREDQAYGIRLTRLDDQQSSSRNTYAYDESAPTSTVVKSTARASAPAQTVAPPPPASMPNVNSNNYETAMKGSCWDESCSLPSCCNNDHWYAYVGGLVMGRDMPNKYWTTYEQGTPANQLLYFPGADWGGGVDTRIGYWFGCGTCGDPCGCCNSCSTGRFGIEAVYWGVWGLDGYGAVTSNTNSLGTVQDDGLVSFNGNAVSDWFDNARRVELYRNDEFHNVEVNFMYMPCCDSCDRFQMTALAGIRYFRFTEGLTWNQFGGSGLPVGVDDEATLQANVQNNLVGFQIGTYMNYRCGNRFSVFAIPKIGIFGNHVVGHNSLINGDGVVATFDNPPGSGNELNIHNTANVFSMLGSIDVGANWAFNQTWSLIAGYRVVMATDMALGDNQIPQFFADEAGWRTIKTNGDLILHGAFAGVEARF